MYEMEGVKREKVMERMKNVKGKDLKRDVV